MLNFFFSFHHQVASAPHSNTWARMDLSHMCSVTYLFELWFQVYVRAFNWVTSEASFTSETLHHPMLQKCDLISDIPHCCMRGGEKILIHFYHSWFFKQHLYVCPWNEMNDPGEAPLINHSKIIRVMKFKFYLISQHMYQSGSAAVICTHISALSSNVGDL